jgi:hypothetical protein
MREAKMFASKRYRWIHEPGNTLSLQSDDFVLWCYHFTTARRKPFFHPVHTSDGILLSCREPYEHVWHRGLWFAWKYLDGVIYWEESEDGAQDGKTEFIGPEEVHISEAEITVLTRLRYCPPHAPPVLEETRHVTASLPRADGTYTIDWRHTFTPVTSAVVIDRLPINKVPGGGYAGLSWRAARSLGRFRALNSEGRHDREVEHQRARWVDLSGSADGGRNLAAGIALFDHPENPRHPPYWRCIMEPGFGYINPCLVMFEPYTLQTGKSLQLCYRTLIHSDWGDAQMLAREYERFSNVPVVFQET